MARFTREPDKDDMLSKPLAAILDNGWLVAPDVPHGGCAILVNRDEGIILICLVDAMTTPVASEDGGIVDLDHTSLIRRVKEAIGSGAANIPVAILAWFPLLDENTPRPKGMVSVDIHCGASDLNMLKDAILDCTENGSSAPGKAADGIEAALRGRPSSIPRATEARKAAGTKSGRSSQESAFSTITVAVGRPMEADNPMLMLIGEGIRREVRDAKVHYGGMSVSLPDLQGPCNLLPALLVVAAESWGATDLNLRGKGGFHVHLVSMPDDKSAWTGFALAGLQASAVLIVTLCINATLRSCRQSDGTICLDSLLTRFVRFMEINGHANMDIQAIKASIEDDDGGF